MAADRNPTKFPDEETTDRWYATHHACLCPFWNYQVLSRYIADTYLGRGCSRHFRRLPNRDISVWA